MTTAKRGQLVGMGYAQVYLAGTDGIGYGTAGEGMANGTTTHAHLLRFPVSAAVPTPQRVIARLRGGNAFRGQVMFGPNEFGSFPLVMGDMDAVFHALAGQSVADQVTNTRWTRFSDNINLADLPQLGLILTAIFQSREDGSDGVNRYVNYIIPRCQIAPGYAPMNYQAEGEATYTVTPTLAGNEPHGLPFGPGVSPNASAMALANNKCVMYAIVTPKPLGFTTYRGDGIATTFTLGYRPTNTAVTLNAAANEHALNKVLTALTSVSTTTGVATKAAAGAAGDESSVIYETDFVAI